MPRYFIDLAYKGTNYHGWQSQPDTTKTVQGVLEQKLSMVLRTPTKVTGAGRTDAGVHARQQFAHFDCDGHIDPQRLAYNLNACLPADIAIQRIIPVHDGAHARFDAKRRTYEYHIHKRKDAFLEERSFQYLYRLDVAKMNAAAQLLLSHRDFECFSKVKTDVGTFICRIFEARWTETDDDLLFTISADRFLRNMVRAIVGTLIDVGLGKITPDDVNRIIESKDRGQAGFSVPAHGLYLTKIEYDYIQLNQQHKNNE
jgi:tRNA pseudouridine38-40 synthase